MPRICNMVIQTCGYLQENARYWHHMDKIQTCKGCGKEFVHKYVSDYCFQCMNSHVFSPPVDAT